MASQRAIDAFLGQIAIAIVGVSRDKKKFGNLACRELHAKGYRVYPVHRTAAMLEGLRCYPSLSSLPEQVQSVLVVVPPAQALEVVRDAAAAGIRHVWLQQGAEGPAVVEACRELGLDVVSGECVLMFAAPSGVHRMHYWVSRLVRRVPEATPAP